MRPPELEHDLDLDSHSLRVVNAIAEHGSITAAAEALGYSQPAISQHLKRLEARIGMPAIERVGRGVRLTEAGQVLARYALPVISALDAAAGELAELSGLRSGRVRLAAFPSASPTIVPRLLAAMNERHPGINISYIEAEPPEAVAAVRESRADLALTFSYPGDRGDPHTESAHGLSVRALSREEMMLVLPAGHPLAASGTVDVSQLSGEAWIAGCPRCRGHLLELCDDSGFTPRIGYETDNFLAVMSMVAAGLGVAVLPTLAIESAGVPAGVVVRPTSKRNFRTIHVVGTPGARQVPAIAATLQMLAELTTGRNPESVRA
ncbi:LysR family transcriptional regulator [Microterricola pindariensis]|uniref:LysR family transcriptional regulator n=1 Tax=Microterricola pindariensis TaxID=478010 RepID=A0ABX5AXB8_9MICO|nr:LysR family transcriptional regulator [Microterricola pindariensis]PPL19024.1 LysR family transcriptional regulator [Microterricola pindariensis]